MSIATSATPTGLRSKGGCKSWGKGRRVYPGPRDTVRHAVLWHRQNLIDLNTNLPGHSSSATQINEPDDVQEDFPVPTEPWAPLSGDRESGRTWADWAVLTFSSTELAGRERPRDRLTSQLTSIPDLEWRRTTFWPRVLSRSSTLSIALTTTFDSAEGSLQSRPLHLEALLRLHETNLSRGRRVLVQM